MPSPANRGAELSEHISVSSDPPTASGHPACRWRGSSEGCSYLGKEVVAHALHSLSADLLKAQRAYHHFKLLVRCLQHS